MADATIENLFNFYRDANGQLLNFEYKGQIFDYVYNQRGDIVAITDELQEVIARYTYDEWGNLEKIDAPTEVGAEIAKANPYRYVGKFGVQYDQDTNLYFMGWRDYDSKIGRFIVADEYEGDDNNPISFNRYLYAEADPVNNIDPDGYLPKWLKKLSKGVKKTAKAAYNFAIGDDIKTLKSKKTKWYQKAGAAVSIASNFIPGGGIVTKAAKAIFKGTRKAVKTYKASRAVSKATRVVRSKSKRVAAKVNKRPKTVHASSIRSTPKGQSSAASKVTHSTPKPKPKATVAPKPARAAKPTRVEKLYLAKGTDKLIGGPGYLQTFASQGTGKTYQTYTKTNPSTGEVYTGRTSGTGTPLENIAKRDATHHMNNEGFGPARLDKSSTNKDAIRGREQQLIDHHGGAKSKGGTSGNKINGISDINPNKDRYLDAANKEW